jgi:hypothetical protein
MTPWKSRLDDLLKNYKFAFTASDGLLNKARNAIRRVFSPKELKGTLKDPSGYEISGEIVLADPEIEPSNCIDFNRIFTLINDRLQACSIKVWILLDRLDDAFPGNPALEKIALRSLLNAYKDIAGLDCLKLKVFIRDDIYKKITETEGFRSLSHINAKAMQAIQWTEEKLLHLFFERLLYNNIFKEYLKFLGYKPEDVISDEDRQISLLTIFRDQVDVGPKNPKTFRWVLNHIKDGNGISTPRDLISFIEKARLYQIEYWRRNGIERDIDYLISPVVLKQAWSDVSKEKLDTQIYAEYPHLKQHIEAFRNGKAEHNSQTLLNILGSDWETIMSELQFIGFIDNKASTWKIPFIYREALGISQGKAFEISTLESFNEDDNE